MVSIELLQQLVFFQNMDKGELAKIVEFCHEEVHMPGENIIREGDEAKKIYLLVEGAIVIQNILKKNQNIIINTIEEKGSFFGWSALVEPKHYRSGIKCLKKSKTISINAGDLEKLFKNDPALGLKLMRKIAVVINQRLDSMKKRFMKTIS